VAILIFNKGKTHKDVLFIDASRSFVTSGRQVRIPAHELERIVQALRDFKDIPGFCRVVSPKEIRDNNFQFSVTHYVPQEKTEEEDIDFEKLRKVISGTEAELAKVRTEIDSFIQSLRIKKL
jgi:type I restriction enzyme M protein